MAFDKLDTQPDLFIPYALAKGLKDLGFEEPCLGRHVLIAVGDKVPNSTYNSGSEKRWHNHNTNKANYIWSAPTYAQAVNWLRDQMKITVYPYYIIDQDCFLYGVRYKAEAGSELIYHTLDEALAEAIQKAKEK